MRTTSQIGGRGLAALGRHLGLWAALYAVQLLFVGASWLAAMVILGPHLAHRPEPDVLGWALLVRCQPGAATALGIAAGGIVAGYLLLGTLISGVVLLRLRGSPFTVNRCAWLLVLRLIIVLALAAVGVGWWISGRAIYELALASPDDRLHVIALLSVSLLFGLPTLLLLLVAHYSQPLVAAGRLPHQALREALALVHRRTWVCLALYLLGWSAWLATMFLGVGSGGAAIAFGQLAAVARVGVHLWLCATATETVKDL
jgi:hypothetical protein